MSAIIQVYNLSKSYVITHEGKESYTALRDVMARKAKKIFSFPKLLRPGPTVEKEVFWALKDINFEIEKGDRVGIIGRNGAGKSTLLKILSRITEPSAGTVKIKGRAAALLEVGTGFHPELTGRENIFLNGAILGMSRAEIKKHFDAIVDFAEVEKFLDTPVKRYSSGMYVRLAFSVAAHLEPEILIVDEVLAVGDAQFQKKCLGKMEDVSKNEGRTVLFVSHNLTAMNSLCEKGIYLFNGRIADIGNIDSAINSYLSKSTDITTKKIYTDKYFGDHAAQLLSARLVNESGEDADIIDFYKGGGIEFVYQVLTDGYLPVPNIHLFNHKGDYVLVAVESLDKISGKPGKYKTVMQIPPHLLNDGRYIAGITLSTMMPEVVHFYDKEALSFEIVEDMSLRNTPYRGVMPGLIRPDFKWTTTKID